MLPYHHSTDDEEEHRSRGETRRADGRTRTWNAAFSISTSPCRNRGTGTVSSRWFSPVYRIGRGDGMGLACVRGGMAPRWKGKGRKGKESMSSPPVGAPGRRPAGPPLSRARRGAPSPIACPHPRPIPPPPRSAPLGWHHLHACMHTHTHVSTKAIGYRCLAGGRPYSPFRRVDHSSFARHCKLPHKHVTRTDGEIAAPRPAPRDGGGVHARRRRLRPRLCAEKEALGDEAVSLWKKEDQNEHQERRPPHAQHHGLCRATVLGCVVWF